MSHDELIDEIAKFFDFFLDEENFYEQETQVEFGV